MAIPDSGIKAHDTRQVILLLSALHGPDHLFMHSCLDGAPDPIPGSDARIRCIRRPSLSGIV